MLASGCRGLSTLSSRVYMLLSAASEADTISTSGDAGGGERDFSHSFIKSEAVFLMLLGARRFRAADSVSSSSLLAEEEGVDGASLGLKWTVCLVSKSEFCFLFHFRRPRATYSGLVLSATFAEMAEGDVSSFTVDPLHRCVDFTVGLSQLDQSLSSYESTVSGAQEKCLAALEGRLLCCCCCVLGASSVTSPRGSTNRDGGVGVSSKALATCGRAAGPDARMVS